MYTQLQRFVATVLLFSLLLQSCGNPNWKIADGESTRGASTKTYHRVKVKQHSESLALAEAESFMEGSMEPKLEGTSALGDASSSQRSTETLAEVVSKAAYELAGELSNALHGDRPITPSPSPVVNVVSQRSSPSSPSRSCSATSERKQSTEKKSRHAVLGKDFIAHRKGAPLVHARSVSTVASASVPQLALAPQAAAHAIQMEIKPSTDDTTDQALSRSMPGNLLTQAYPSSQGHQVRFHEQAGTWMAQVEDVWGRRQELPLVCAPDQTPERVLQQLSSKALGQHKYWVHVFNTHQPPWAPRVVYIGALGIRGGGNSSSRCCHPSAINAGYNSDGEPDGAVRSGGYTFYRSNTNNWCVEIVPGNLGCITRADNSMTLSANDIRAIGSWSHHDCNAGWDNCYVPNTSYSTITAQREHRREERRRRQEEARRQDEERRRQEEARRQEEERKRQEEARRQEEERKRQEEARRQAEERKRQEEARRQAEERKRQEEARRQAEERKRQEEARRQEEERKRQEIVRRQAEERKRQEEARRQEEERRRQEEARRQEEERRRQEEARRKEEERRRQEEARRKEEERRRQEEARVAELETMREQLESSLKNQALPELNLRLGELGIAYQEIPLSVFYNAIQTAMTQIVPDVQMPDNPDDLQASEEAVNELLTGMQEAFNEPGIPLPSQLKKVLGEIDIEAFRPHARALVAQVEAAQAAKAALIEANEIEVQESIARIQASTEKLRRANQTIAQQMTREKEAEEAAARERQAAYYRATKDIAVLSSKHFFIPKTRVGFLEELQNDLQALQEDLLEIPVNKPLPQALQEDIKYIWNQINKDQKALTPLYRHMRKSMDHYATDMLNNEQAKKALSLRTAQEAHAAFTQTELEVLEKEAAMIKQEKEDAMLAKEILEELDNMRQALCEILEARQVLLVDYDLEVYEPDWKNDYSQEELTTYMTTCSQVPQNTREQVFIVSLQATAATLFTNIRATLGQRMPVTKQDFLDLLQSAPQLGQQVVAYYPYIADMPTNSATFARVHGLVMHAILTSESMRKEMKVQHFSEFKKRMHQLSIATKQAISNPQQLLH